MKNHLERGERASKQTDNHEWKKLKSGIAGGISGLAVDTILYPLDTLKTRLQSTRGYSGGFSTIYRGITSSCIGSIPSASLFFITYDTFSTRWGHVQAACMGEIVACLVRVPIDNIKQHMQTTHTTLRNQIQSIYQSRGILGFYKSFGITVMRDVPFACIQFPLYQWLKSKEFECWQSGMIAGGFSACVTTPIDVLKTNITLQPQKRIVQIIQEINPISGIIPRMLWISLGGSIFLTTHDTILSLLT
jgi:solute carrier family 25 (mitochondrial S-adenosylmethionine transporter), member 26